MKNILIVEYADGDSAISYEAGKECRKQLDRNLDQGEKVALDFDGVNHVIGAFLNPVIGDLILERGTDVTKRIIIKNANQTIFEKIKIIKDGALSRIAKPEE